jgi:hypothetical protein
LVPQVVVQLPQCAASVIGSTQACPHASWPVAHCVLQVAVPPVAGTAQSSPVAQVVPHVPQLSGSDFVSTQAPLQSVLPTHWQLPSTQLCPPPQVVVAHVSPPPPEPLTAPVPCPALPAIDMPPEPGGVPAPPPSPPTAAA